MILCSSYNVLTATAAYSAFETICTFQLHTHKYHVWQLAVDIDWYLLDWFGYVCASMRLCYGLRIVKCIQCDRHRATLNFIIIIESIPIPVERTHADTSSSEYSARRWNENVHRRTYPLLKLEKTREQKWNETNEKEMRDDVRCSEEFFSCKQFQWERNCRNRSVLFGMKCGKKRSYCSHRRRCRLRCHRRLQCDTTHADRHMNGT